MFLIFLIHKFIVSIAKTSPFYIYYNSMKFCQLGRRVQSLEFRVMKYSSIIKNHIGKRKFRIYPAGR